MIEFIESQTEWSILLLQEISLSEEIRPASVVNVGCHSMYVGNSLWRASAVIINASISHAVATTRLQGASPIVTLQTRGLEWDTAHPKLFVASAHLPHSGHPDADFYDATLELGEVFSLKDKGRVIVGVDANICMPVSQEEPLICAFSPHLRVDDRRTQNFEQLCQSHRMRLLNACTHAADERLHTHRQWATGVLSMRDFILDSATAPSGSDKSWVESEWEIASDHRAVGALVHACPVLHRFNKRRPKNWRPSDRAAFNESVNSKCNAEGDFSLVGLTSSIAQSAADHGSCSRLTLRDSKDDAAVLSLMSRQLRLESNPEERARLAKLIWRQRRRGRRARKRALAVQCISTGSTTEFVRLTSQSFTPKSLEGSVDKTTWSGSLTSHFQKIFTIRAPEVCVWRSNLERDIASFSCDVSQLCDLDRGSEVPWFTDQEIRAAIGRLKKGKTTGTDMVSAEMLQALDESNLTMLTEALNDRAFLGAKCPPGWNQLDAFLLHKIAKVSLCDHYRPITILPVIKKLLLSAALARASPYLYAALRPFSLACRKGIRASEPIHVLRSLVEKAVEWRMPLFAAKLDMKKAFDSLKQSALQVTMSQAGVPPHLRYIILRELLELRITFSGDGISTEPVDITGGIPQGDPGSALGFTATADRVVAPLEAKWQKDSDCGFTLLGDGFKICVMAWMDDIYLLASSQKGLTKMLGDVQRAFPAVGLQLQPGKCVWTTTQPDHEGGDIILGGVPMVRSPRQSGLVMLGAHIPFWGNNEEEVNARLSSAWKCFFLHSPMLLCPDAPFPERLRILASTVTPVVSWGLETAALTKKGQKDLDVAHVSMVSAIIGRRRAPGEPWLAWYKRRRREARKVLGTMGLLLWSQTLKLRVLAWSHKVANKCPSSYLAKVSLWRNLAWWRQRQQAIAAQEKGLRHPARFTPRRWEQAVVTYWASLVQSDPLLPVDWQEGARSYPNLFLGKSVDWAKAG